ncbi:tryptophan 7-halogenase [Sphingomonas piscis]|uniref:Tryptophan 7-halogenase n=1 Tax=Sphingomonas piscis TaxID=2714943 RepID=A0A6G7YMT2_9SPHN|nr:tryptophan 7-halogenase [Sphingomonas piscis]QIK78048.1 tryptophan 7-halogenase [Sphingomonas piscis]
MPRPSDAPLYHLVVVGSGLAAAMTVATLARQLPSALQISWVQVGNAPDSDILYGNAAGPTAYEFNRRAGIEEPALITGSDTAFSWGTKYEKWAAGERSWIQCYQLPFPVIDGILFHQFLARERMTSLEPFLVSAIAARKGLFAHPPQESAAASQSLLSNAEYGYQIDPSTYGRMFEEAVPNGRVRILRTDGVDLQVEGDEIVSVSLVGGENIEGGLFVDCTGPEARLLSRLQAPVSTGRTIGAALSTSTSAQLGAPLRTVAPTAYGWRSDTPLQGKRVRLNVFDASSRDEAKADHPDGPERTCEAELGSRTEAWVGNCVGVGQAAHVAEPLTIAPILLLERDVERLVSLIPLSGRMAVERREYCRRAREDYEHAGLFTQAMFQTEGLPEGTYWQVARGQPVNDKLVRKINMFEQRGLLVSYDLEPFHPEDWTVLHYGMGRRPRRHDRLADRAPADRIRGFLAAMKAEVEKVAGSLPPHAVYVDQLKLYLQKNKP